MEGVRPQRYPTASGLAATGEPHTFGELDILEIAPMQTASCAPNVPCSPDPVRVAHGTLLYQLCPR